MKKTISIYHLLLAFCLFIGLLIGIRSIYSGSVKYLFLVWNIFLASVQLLISASFKSMHKRSGWKQIMLFACWLIFFPNALYIVTDLLHLDQESNVPRWFDVLLLFSSSVLGLAMAYLSLFRVEDYLLKVFKQKQVDGIIGAILFFGSFGVYLGRFLRWNSWDIIRNPFGLMSSVIQRFIFPFSHTRTWGITILFGILFYLIYLFMKKLSVHLNTFVKT